MTEDISPDVKIFEANYLGSNDLLPTQNIALFVGEFEKGPINEPKLISSAIEFKLTFGRATDFNFNDWYQVYNYLQYPGSPKIFVCRTSGPGSAEANNGGIIASSPGEWGNLLTVEIYDKNNHNNYLKEIFGYYSITEITDDYFVIIRRKDIIVQKFTLSDANNLNSNYIKTINLQPGIYALSGGYSEPATAFEYRESFEIFTKENYEIDIVISPENYNDVVVDFVESRKDCIGFLCVPRELVNYLMINGVHLATEDGSLIVLSIKNLIASKADYESIVSYIKNIIKSKYCFMTFGFKIQEDGFTGKNRIITVNGDIAGLKALNSSIVSWGIPAGVERGNIKNAKGYTMKISKSDADKLYKLGVNTLSNGTLMTQKMFIDSEEKFSRLHQRCVLNYVERAVEKLARKYVFDSNNRNTRATLALQTKKILEDMLSSGAIEGAKVYVTTEENKGEKIIININIRIPHITEIVNLRMQNIGTNMISEII